MNRPIALASMALSNAILAGCGMLAPVERSRPDDLDAWRAQPLPPDPALAALALGEHGACRMDDPSDAVAEPLPQLLVQDRRTQDTAIFLMQNPNHFGSCTVTRASGMAGSGYGPPLQAMTGPLSLDDQASGTLGDGIARELGGRVAVPAARVVVHLDDGTNVTASLANGYWLTWWPLVALAKQVVALDASGAVLASLEVPNP